MSEEKVEEEAEELPARIRERGIRFASASKKDGDRVWTFLRRNFFPDEPIFRSIKFCDSDLLSRYLRRWYRGHVLSACLNWEDPPSLLALDPRGEIVGAVLGYRTRRSDPRNPGAFSPLVHRLRRLLPARIVDLNLTARFDRERLRYDAHLAMDDLGCSDVFVGETLCVASSCRGLGLGRALLRASVGAAGAAGAEVYFSCVTGVYSQKIYRDCDFDDLREVPYSDVRNNKGEPLLPETGEHEKAAVMFKRLRQREEPLKSGELAGNG